tara:strand:+ start:3165 stop:4181 length:1017 start_codon:yes stop_codon:yes gene_type:complete
VLDLTQTLVDFIEIPSITGTEEDYGDALARELVNRGFQVERQEVEPGRFNLLARAGAPEVVFCTHLDTVPPFFGSKVANGTIHGRGSCDAKGQAVAMLAAGERMLQAGEDRIGFLFTVGEEETSDGAKVANAKLAEPWRPRYTIVGEPTDGMFIRGHKGLFHAKLHAHGVAGHSSQKVGPSAVHELIRVTAKLLDQKWGEHPVFGPGTVNLGTLVGGVAANVVADRAEASVLLRAVESPDVVEARIREHLGEHVELEITGNVYGPLECHVPEGEDSKIVAFGTDAPHMPAWGTPLLFGAGSILDAHTDHEKIEVHELEDCVGRLTKTASDLLARGTAR